MTQPRSTDIFVNGSARTLHHGATLTDLVTEVTGRAVSTDGRAADGGRLGIAVARNAEVVPRGRWAETALEPGDDIEILTAVQGG